MATNLNKPSVPTKAQTLPYYYVTRASEIVRVSWDEMTTTEREMQRQADDRAFYNANFGIYA